VILFVLASLATSLTEGSWIVLSDVTAEAGISFRHDHGGSGRRYIVEIAGGGVLAFDYDADELPDLFYINGSPLPGTNGTRRGNALYRNLGDGTFVDVTERAGISGEGYGMGGAASDLDNDGDIDVLMTAFGEDQLYINNGDGTFRVGRERGVADERWSSSATFFELDRDGFLDLYVANYLDFTFATHRECVSPTAGLPAYCHPQEYGGVADVLYRNRGDGTFEDVSSATEVAGLTEGKGLGVVALDFDDDGDSDLYVANDTTRNYLYRNDGGGRLTEVGVEAGVAYNEQGLAEAGMGVDAADVDRDGRLDLVVTNFDFENNTLYRNVGGGFFFDATSAFGLGAVSLTELGFGCDFLDLDNDGWQDLVVVNGHILDNIAEIQSNLSFAQPGQVFRNENGRFRDLTASSGTAIGRPRVGRGLASLDFDRDGDLDLAISSRGGAAELLRNDGENAGGFIGLRLVGVASNRDGVGARLTLELEGRPWVDELRAGSSYLAQNEMTLYVGLGSAAKGGGLSLRWPSGRVEEIETLEAGRWYVVKEGVGVIR
jgi:hypothetical protein